MLKNYETLYAENGWGSVLLKNLEIIKASDANGSTAYARASLSALASESEQSFRHLDEAVKNRSLEVSGINGDPAFDLLRSDPRFVKLIERSGSR